MAMKEATPRPQDIIVGMMTRGDKMIIAGGSKKGKSHYVNYLEACVAYGLDFFGRKTNRTRVLHVDTEMEDYQYESQFIPMKIKLLGDLDDGDEEEWHIDVHTEDLDEIVTMQTLADIIVNQFGGMDIGLITIDPVYSVFEGDENSQKDWTAFSNILRMLSRRMNRASILCVHHFTKGRQDGKFDEDRASGSGVIQRFFHETGTLTELYLPDDLRDAHPEWTPEASGLKLTWMTRERKIAEQRFIYDEGEFSEITDGSLDDCVIITPEDTNKKKKHKETEEEKEERKEHEKDEKDEARLKIIEGVKNGIVYILDMMKDEDLEDGGLSKNKLGDKLEALARETSTKAKAEFLGLPTGANRVGPWTYKNSYIPEALEKYPDILESHTHGTSMIISLKGGSEQIPFD